MNLRIVFKFKDCKLQFYEKRRLFCYFSVNPRTPASRWRRSLKLKRKKSGIAVERYAGLRKLVNSIRKGQKQELHTKLYRGVVQYGKRFDFITRTVNIRVV